MIPLGEGMRELSLQSLLKERLNHIICGSSLLSMTMNMDEDICAGACRLSHLILDGRIAFDERMKDKLVFYYGEQNHLVFQSKESEIYFITMGEDYLSSLEGSQWKSLPSSSEEEAMLESRFFLPLLRNRGEK